MARADCRGQRDQDDLGALAADPQDAVAVFLAQVGDAGAGGFEDPQAQQPEHGHQGEVVAVRRLACGGQQRLELQMGESEGGRFGWDIRPADVLGRGVLQHGVADAGAVEPGGYREPPRDGGGLEPAGFLHPPDVLLQVRAAGGQRVQAALSAPSQVTAQVGLGVLAGGAREPGPGRRTRPAGPGRVVAHRLRRGGGSARCSASCPDNALGSDCTRSSIRRRGVNERGACSLRSGRRQRQESRIEHIPWAANT